jgi:hypothetical protein
VGWAAPSGGGGTATSPNDGLMGAVVVGEDVEVRIQFVCQGRQHREDVEGWRWVA